MKETKKNQARPIRLSLIQANRVVWLVEDLLDALHRGWSDDDKAVMESLIWQIQVVNAENQAALVDDRTKNGSRPRKPVDKSR